MSDTTVTLAADAALDLEWLRSSTAAALTLTQTADVMGVDPRTISAAIKRGELPSIRIGRRILIPRPQLLALIEGSTQSAAR